MIKLFYHFLFLLLLSNSAYSQSHVIAQWNIDTFNINGISHKIPQLTINLENKKKSKIIFWENDSLKLRAVFYFSAKKIMICKKYEQPGLLKVRFDIWQNNKWYKAPLKIDTHFGTRFKINRSHCWSKTSRGYNAGYPYKSNCGCYKPLNGKSSHTIYLQSKITLIN